MEGKGIESEPHRLTKKHFTKEQRKVIGELTSEWGLLDSADHLISKLVFKQYQALRPGMKRPPELVELEREQDVISKRKREISAELNELEEGIHPRRRRPGRRSDPYVLVRNGLIRASRHRRDKDIAQELDLELGQGDMPALGLPEKWTEKYGVTSYSQAYSHRKCKPLVQKLISAAKAAS